MKNMKMLIISILITCPFFIISCGEKAAYKEPAADIKSGVTIGEFSQVFISEPIEVEGYGLVGGLRGTGSSQCPPQIRLYLEQYILKNLPGQKNISELIDSPDTAVVYVYGKIPALAMKGENFDIKVAALDGTETTSLEGGILWGADLRAKSRFEGLTKVLSQAEGSLYIDKIDANDTSKRSGMVLAGGKVLDDYPISVVTSPGQYRITGQIRDKINERFGRGTARAISSEQIDLRIPAKYKQRKVKFIQLVRATSLAESVQATSQNVEQLVSSLETSKNKESVEIMLEAAGNIGADKIATALRSADREVRFRAARCLINLGDDRGLETLREIAFDKTSPYRKEAVEAIGFSARRNDATAILQGIIRDYDDFEMRWAAYEQLSRLEDISIRRSLIGRNFYLDEATEGDRNSIYVSRSGRPCIVLFGPPMYCHDGSFVQSEDGIITINALPGADKVLLTRKVAGIPPITVSSTYRLGDIIETLCEEAKVSKESGRMPGLNVPYSEMTSLLKQMCEKGAVSADFHAGKFAQID